MKLCSTGLGKQQLDTGFEYYPGQGSRDRQSLGTYTGFGRKTVFEIANLAIIWGVAITGARDRILVNQEREYGKKIRRELNMTVVCWCWIVQDEKENVQTVVSLDLKYGLSTGRPGQSVQSVFIESAL